MQKANITNLFSRTILCVPFADLFKKFKKVGTGKQLLQNQFYFGKTNKNQK